MDEHDRMFKLPRFSTDLQERTLIGGPMAHLDNDQRSYRCFNCGRTSVPTGKFATVQDYQGFRR